MNVHEPQTIILVGGPGSGKGTQAALLQKYLEDKDPLPAYYVNAGDGFRALFKREKESFIARKTAEITRSGKFHKDYLVIWNNVNQLIETMKENGHIILDSPRQTTHEPRVWDGMYETLERARVYVINFIVDDSIAIKRLLKRGRHDDTEGTIQNRLDHFNSVREELLDFYRSHDRYVVIDVDASQNAEKVHESIIMQID